MASGASRRIRVAVVRLALAIALASLVFTAAASSHQRTARAASGTTCKLSKKDWTSFGYSYFEWLWVDRTSCSTGRAVAKKHGHVPGWRCSSKTTAKSAFQYDATETCKGGSRIVEWKYTQNTERRRPGAPEGLALAH